MYYAGCSACMVADWVDDPRSSIVFQDENLAAQTLNNEIATSNTPDFPITLKPVKFNYDDEEEEFDSSTDS